ncbi:helix-turn-helix domain-containing protein [Paenibacillus sp. HJL G12]|uniref:Helix-turn-helix domain-containing protein n=1 Tax=Paenibacillus dendrobii TaxID=2691084 RepID=A0A7X3IL36_9BACL|nr:helix-turn-helix transcriptional regulator [Paenibacillus dendrobii]MWV44042.1 helix-turn-helix domain-containing protein [Paenibacillus dendrobii]
MNDKIGAYMLKKDIVLWRVKELREEKNLSQLEFAESIDVSSNTISRIERGEMSLSSDIALKIADTYGISLDWLFNRGDDQLSPKLRANLQEAINCIQENISIPPRLKINKKTPSD